MRYSAYKSYKLKIYIYKDGLIGKKKIINWLSIFVLCKYLTDGWYFICINKHLSLQYVRFYKNSNYCAHFHNTHTKNSKYVPSVSLSELNPLQALNL